MNDIVAANYYVEIDLLESNFMITRMEDMANLTIKIRVDKRSFYPHKSMQAPLSNHSYKIL